MNIDHVKEIEQNKFDVVYILQWTGCPKVLQLCENGKDGEDGIFGKDGTMDWVSKSFYARHCFRTNFMLMSRFFYLLWTIMLE